MLSFLLLALVAPTLPLPTLLDNLVLDGNLDEEVWKHAAIISHWTQQQPNEGESGTIPVRAYLWKDHEAFYLGFEMETSEVLHSYQKRDQRLWNDDKVEIVLSPHNDGRNGYYFGINANGSRVDGTITDEGRADIDWDGFWEGAGRLTPEGWSAEVRIPFWTLSVDPDRDDWGFNIKYWWNGGREDARWSGWERPNQLSHLSQAGSLSGMAGLSPTSAWTFLPFVLGKITGQNETHTQGQIGLDILGSPKEDWRVAAVINADFGEAEADSQQSNLTRFSLFFPEKRDFFLENAGLFEFGEPRVAQAFHSRRVGLDSGGNPAPLRLGVKLTGREGSTEAGLLTAFVDETNDALFSVLRLRHNLSPSLTAGVIQIARSGGTDHSTTGADWDWRRNDVDGTRWQTAGWVQNTDALGETGSAWAVKAKRHSDPFSFSISYLSADSGFDPQVGFYRYGGQGTIGVMDGEASYVWDAPWKGVRRFSHESEYSQLVDGDGDLIESTLEFKPWGLEMDSGWSWTPTITLNEANLDNPFTPFSLPDITIPAGNHQWTEVGLSLFGHFQNYKWVFMGRVSVGEWYDADRINLNNWINWKVTDTFSFGPSINWDRVEREGSTDQSLTASFDISWTPTPFQLAKIVIQQSSSTDLWLLNARWELRPRDGDATFVVFDMTDQPSNSSTDDSWRILIKKEWLVD
ncbi:carbohydrate binding family 9 domain-containing protein [bacterium]|nr:carbohydrate binding family 9 domain-containing protein [bacterium]